jgi:hypothetical protein
VMIIQRRTALSSDKHRHSLPILNTQFTIYFNSFSMVSDEGTAKFNSFHFEGAPSCF